jgi:hypothetical protein
MSTPYLLLLGAAMPFRESAAPAVRRMLPGRRLADVTASRLAPSAGFDRLIPGDPFLPAVAVQAVRGCEAESGWAPTAVIPFSERTVDAAVAVADAYGLPRHPHPDLVRDKLRMKERWRAAGLPVGRFAAFDDLPTLRAASAGLGRFPQVLKPRLLGGSIGVRRVDAAADLDAAFHDCRRTIDHAGGGADPGGYLVEEFINGDELSVEVINWDGKQHLLGMVDKAVTPPPFFAEIGQAVPSRRSADGRISALARRGCEALDLRYGWAHVELFVRADGDLILSEVGARPAGDLIPDLLEMVYGVNGYGLHAASYVGPAEVPAVGEPRGSGAVAFLKAPPGRIAAIRQPAALPDGVSRVVVTAAVGELSGPAESNHDREGYVLFHWPGAGPAPDPVRTAAELSRTVFVMQPAD